MKKLARLVLFFSLSFIIMTVSVTGFRFLVLWVQWMCSLPQENMAVLPVLITAARWALSVALYGSILFSLSYSIRREVFAPIAMICLMILSLAFTFGISLSLEQLEHIEPIQQNAGNLGGAGVILNQVNTSVVLLNGPGDPRGPRVTAFTDKPLLYQAEPAGPNNSVLPLPPLPLEIASPWFLKSIAIDFRMSAEQLDASFSQGIIPFFIYAGALVFFLVSLGFIFRLSAWPLANLFFGIVVFRLILGMEVFFNSPEMQETFSAFLANHLPVSLTVPLIFCVLGLLVTIYSVLVYLAKRRSYEEDIR